MSLPSYVAQNREAWTQYSAGFEEPGRRDWARPDIVWGMWGISEAQIGALGDLTWFKGKDIIELGCGTAYFSAWFAKLGAKPVGIDITPAQLDKARMFQREFGIEFPLIEGNAEEVPLPDATFDFAFSEYGASIWCEPTKFVAEASRLLRPGGTLVFMRTSTLSVLCSPPADDSVLQPTLVNDYDKIREMEWEGSHEFHLTPGEMIRTLRQNEFEVEDLISVLVPKDWPASRFPHATLEWGTRWPAEEIWRARKKA